MGLLDPDPDWIRIEWACWIQIRIRNPDPDPLTKKKLFQGENVIATVKIIAGIFLKTSLLSHYTYKVYTHDDLASCGSVRLQLLHRYQCFLFYF
jgi:hypothetical protein